MQNRRASTVTGCAVILRALLFAKHGSRSEGGFAPTLTHAGDTFGRELAKNHRFGSLGLNLTFEGLLLGVSLRLQVKATLANPTNQTLSQPRQCTMRGKHCGVL
jgi:hypothetical protein